MPACQNAGGGGGPDKCTECQGFHEEPQCASVCPVDSCVPDEMYHETVEELMVKKEKLHG